MRNVPLRTERIVVIALLGEITLLPLAAVNEGNIVFREFHQRVRLGKVWQDGVRVKLGVTNDIRHPRFAPAFIDGGMTGFTGGGAGILRRLTKTAQRDQKQEREN